MEKSLQNQVWDYFGECTKDLKIPSNFTNVSWHNDALPSYEYDKYQIFINHKDIDERMEFEEEPRFWVILKEFYGDCDLNDGIGIDDFDDVLEYINYQD
jgi:hypothetical protein